MRLWHYQLLKGLPKNQLVSQLRECVAIAKNIYEKGTPNHILVNKIMNYDLNHFRLYCWLVIQEMENRQYKVSKQTKDKLNEYIGYYKPIAYVEINNILLYDGSDFNIDLFGEWHNMRYLNQCMCNLEEKYDCGGINDSEWDNLITVYTELLKSRFV